MVVSSCIEGNSLLSYIFLSQTDPLIANNGQRSVAMPRCKHLCFCRIAHAAARLLVLVNPRLEGHWEATTSDLNLSRAAEPSRLDEWQEEMETRRRGLMIQRQML